MRRAGSVSQKSLQHGLNLGIPRLQPWGGLNLRARHSSKPATNHDGAESGARRFARVEDTTS